MLSYIADVLMILWVATLSVGFVLLFVSIACLSVTFFWWAVLWLLSSGVFMAIAQFLYINSDSS